MDAEPAAAVDQRKVEIASMNNLQGENVMSDIEAALKRILELEKRVTALEEQLGGKSFPEFCHFCGEPAVRLHSACAPEPNGNVHEEWKCKACGQVDLLVYRPRSKDR
jgi:hypothetical protein